PSGNTTGAANPVQASSVLPPGLPPFVLSEIYYFEPATGTRYEAAKQGSTWVLPLVDTMRSSSLTFLFASNVPRQEIADIVEKKACCYALLLAGQSVAVNALTFSGDKVFVRSSVPDMRTWPKTVQLRMFHQGIVASPSGAAKSSASASGAAPTGPGLAQGAIASRQNAATAPVLRPFMDYRSTPVTLQPAKVSYFAKFLYPTFSHQRCTDCHSMGDAAAVRAQHDALGVPGVNAQNAHQATCGGTSCHTFVKDWRTPPFAIGINWRGKGAREVCKIVTSHLPSAEGLHAHFHDDPRVIWAVSSGWIPANGHGKGQGFLPTAPPHNQQAWFQLVDYWINGGFPCPE
ncbi:MAG: hypothetical protein WCC53_07880, partial [Thermoanaerobaculia bacterium]